MLVRALSLAAVCLLLSSCQPPGYDIIAHLRGAELIFEARGSGTWPFRDDDGISADWVQVRNRDQLVWAIERDRDRTACKPVGDTPPFPLVYGRVPACFRERVAARPIRKGIAHRIDGEGFRTGHGLFRLEGKAINLDWDDVWRDVQSWPPLPDPRFPPGPGNGEPYEPLDGAESDAGVAGNASQGSAAPEPQPKKNIPAAPAAADRSATSR